MNHLSRLAVAAVALVAALFVGSACEGVPTTECSNNDQCGAGQVCSVSGTCLECNVSGDCDDGEFCCQGVCRGGDEVADRCGCGASPEGNPGVACGSSLDAAVCLVGDSVATADNVQNGFCGCGCSIADGGPICGPAGDDGAPTCTCSENSDCRGAALDAAGRPHRAADTCTPQGSCVCFSLGASAVCDPDSATPDCASAGGCAAFASDVDNCGSAGHVCDGVADANSCADGGCACDAAADCIGGVNVDTCAFVDGADGARCVCDAYSKGGVKVGCPMELECSIGGCVLDGTAYASEEALVAALAAR